jgi:hypothetical protein
VTDWAAEWLAGEAIGLKLTGIEGRDAFMWLDDDTCEPWMPLGSDEQAMRLVRRLHLHIDQRPGKQLSVQDPHFVHLVYGDLSLGAAAINRAIVECAAKIQAAKHG